MLHAFLHKQSHTPTHSPYCQVALMDAHPWEPLCMCECVAEEICTMGDGCCRCEKHTIGDFQRVCVCVCVCVLQRCSWAKSWCFRTLGGFSCRHSRRIVRKLPASRLTTTIELWYSTCMCTHRWTHRCTHMPPADVEAHSKIQWGLELWRGALRWDCGIKIANWKC